MIILYEYSTRKGNIKTDKVYWTYNCNAFLVPNDFEPSDDDIVECAERCCKRIHKGQKFVRVVAIVDKYDNVVRSF